MVVFIIFGDFFGAYQTYLTDLVESRLAVRLL